MSLNDRLRAIDRRQQSTPGVRFVAAVIKKAGDDQAGHLAALISYYAFVSLFPLLLVLVTVLGFVLQNDPDLRQQILQGTLGQIPLISDQLEHHSLSGSNVALVIGIVGALLAGMGITNATQDAFNRIWGVPFKARPDFIHARLRGLGMLAILGTLSIVSIVVAGYVGSASHGALTVVSGVVLAFVTNLALFMIAFKLLCAADLSWRELWVGVVIASVFWQLLQHLGGYYVDHVLKRTGPLYGVFAVVLGTARVALPRRTADHLRRRGQCCAPPPAMAADPALGWPSGHRQARSHVLCGSRGAGAARGRPGHLRSP